MAWYRNGTIALTNGNPGVVGTSTLWLSYAKAGDGMLLPDGKVYEVLNVVDDTHITLATNYGGSTASGQSYGLFPTHAFSIQLSKDLTTLYNQINGYLSTALAGRFANGSAAAPALSFTSDTDTGLYSAGSNQVGGSANGAQKWGWDAASGLYALELFTVVMTAGAGWPKASIGQSADNPYIETQRWSGSGSNYAGWRLKNANGVITFELSSIAVVASQTWSEAMRVSSLGELLIGTTSRSAGGTGKLEVVSDNGTDGITSVMTNSPVGSPCYVGWHKTTTGDASFAKFFTETSITARGSITYNRGGGLTAYNTTSDYRAKDILGTVADPGAVIDAVPVHIGRMHGATVERPMFVAHEVQEHAPYAVTGTKDAVDDNGAPVLQQMDASALVPLMWAELQALRARVAALESRP